MDDLYHGDDPYPCENANVHKYVKIFVKAYIYKNRCIICYMCTTFSLAFIININIVNYIFLAHSNIFTVMRF